MTPIIEALIFIGASIVCALLYLKLATWTGRRLRNKKTGSVMSIGKVTWIERRR